MRALILDDDGDFRSLVRGILHKLGLEVAEARSGAEGKTIIGHPGVDLAVVDGSLPDDDGVNWISWLRKGGHAIPVMFVSGTRKDTPPLRRALEAVGVTIMLQKPIDPAAFSAKVKTLVDQIQRSGASLAGPDVSDPSMRLASGSGQALDPAAQVRDLQEKVQQVAHAVAAVRKSPDDELVVRNARALAQGLQRSAGALGMSQAAESANKLDDALAKIAELPSRAGALAGSMAAFVVELRKAAANPPVIPNAPVAGLTVPALTALEQSSDFMKDFLTDAGGSMAVPPHTDPRAQPASARPASPAAPPQAGFLPGALSLPALSALEASADFMTDFFAGPGASLDAPKVIRPRPAAPPAAPAPSGPPPPRAAPQAAVAPAVAAPPPASSAPPPARPVPGATATAPTPTGTGVAPMRGMPPGYSAGAAPTPASGLTPMRGVPMAGAAPTPAALAPMRGAPQAAPVSTADGTGEWLLVVDDDTELLKLMVATARRYNLRVLSATSTAEALARVREQPPQAALLDVNLVGDDKSFHLARQLRELPGLERLPIAFVSAAAGIANRVAAAHVGASFFLPKPFSPDAFGAAARRLLALAERDKPSIVVASGDARLTQRLGALGQHAGATVEAGATTARIPELLEARHRDLLLVDADLPGLSPHDVCRAIRIDPRLQNLPVVFLSSLVGPAERLAAFQAGADDILPKSTPDDELRIRIRLLLDRARLREVRTRIDPLTGLLTREAFLEDLIGSLQQTARAKHPLTFAMIDINGLAAINRKHGFAGGDRVLASVGRQLRLAFMGDVLRGRWGDDEFVVAFPGEDSSTIGGVMQRVQDDIRQLRLTDARGTPFVATISVGLGCSPHDGTSAEELAMCAEQRLGEAKVRESEAQV